MRKIYRITKKDKSLKFISKYWKAELDIWAHSCTHEIYEFHSGRNKVLLGRILAQAWFLGREIEKEINEGQIKWKEYTCTQQNLDCLSRRYNEMDDQAVYTQAKCFTTEAKNW